MSETKLENFTKALASFNRAVAGYKKKKNTDEFDTYRDSVIKRFELTFEAAWKCLADYLESENVKLEIKFPRHVIREAHDLGLIKDEKVWLDLLKCRNLTAHIYKEAMANDLAQEITERYSGVLNELLKIINEGRK